MIVDGVSTFEGFIPGESVSPPDSPTVPVSEGMKVMESSVIPASVPVGIVGGHDHGFKPSDAALVRAGQSSDESRSNLRETFAGAKDNLRETLESKFQLERSIKNTELALERAARTSDAMLQSVRIELASAVKDEGVRTRELMMAQAASRTAVELADQKAAASNAAVLAAIKAITPK